MINFFNLIFNDISKHIKQKTKYLPLQGYETDIVSSRPFQTVKTQSNVYFSNHMHCTHSWGLK